MMKHLPSLLGRRSSCLTASCQTNPRQVPQRLLIFSRLMLELYRELYAGKYDPIQTFMVHDFYEILEKAIDRCREAGVVTYQIVLKNN